VLCGLLDDETALEKLGSAARARFEQSFDSEVAGPLLRDLLIQVSRDPQ
jgi:hypothetical protein